MDKLPTSNFEVFRNHIMNPNKPFELSTQEGRKMKIRKNIVLAYKSDDTGCGILRTIIPMNYLNAIYGKPGIMNTIVAPGYAMTFQHDVLLRTRSIFCQRVMNPAQIKAIKTYKDNQSKYGYKLVYDLDDFIFDGPDEGETIPEYNFGKGCISPEVQHASIEIMNMMDTVIVSTDFLGEYIKNKGVTKPNIVTIPNAVAKYLWGPGKKRPIKEKIKKPRIIYSGSPTHYSNQLKLKGDWENAWCDWVIKNVRDNKIDFCCMGGCPWFFEPIRDKIKVVDWVTTYQFHLPIKTFRPDFGIAPLVPNYFNYSKSFIKYQEYCAVGALGIGTTFTNGKPSPYDVCLVKALDNITMQGIDEIFERYTEPEEYNKIIKEQYNQMNENGWWLESEKHIKRYLDVL